MSERGPKLHSGEPGGESTPDNAPAPGNLDESA